MKDKQKQYRGEIIDNTDLIFNTSKAYARTFGMGKKFHKAHYQTMKKLVNNLQYENVIYLHIEDWKELLSVSCHGNVHHKLRAVSHLIEIRSSRTDKDVARGFMKVLVNPEYGYRVSQQKPRDQAIKQFRFLQDLSEVSKKDITLSDFYQSIKNSEEVAS